MAINAYGDNLATNGVIGSVNNAVADKSKLGKDDFMNLLLTEMKYQDPTSPMDTEKILAQTSQLATLESSENTNTALESLAKSLSSSRQFGTIAAIGKTADLGNDSIAHDESSSSNFEIFFPDNINSGIVEISNSLGEVVKTIDIDANPTGVYQFNWDGSNFAGEYAESGIYHINAKYTNDKGESKEAKLGAYPIESVKFDGGDTLVKLGSSYVPLSKVKEVY